MTSTSPVKPLSAVRAALTASPVPSRSRWTAVGKGATAVLEEVRELARVEGAGALPSNELLESACVELAPGSSEERLEWRPGSERLIYVLAGEAEIAIDWLSGTVGPHGFVHIPSGARHAVRNVGSDVLRFVSVYALDPPGVGLLDPLPTSQ